MGTTEGGKFEPVEERMSAPLFANKRTSTSNACMKFEMKDMLNVCVEFINESIYNIVVRRICI